MSFELCLARSVCDMLEHPGEFRHEIVSVTVWPGFVVWALVVNGQVFGNPRWN